MKKDTFILYTQFSEMISELSDEQAGIILKSIFLYVETGEEPNLTGLLKMAFIPIRQQLDRTNEKWEKQSKINSVNGSKGGRPTKANALNENPTETDEQSNYEEKANGYLEKRTVILESEQETEKPNAFFEKPNVLVPVPVLVPELVPVNDNVLVTATANAANAPKGAQAAAIEINFREKILEHWNENCKNLPKADKLTPKRGAAIQKLLNLLYSPSDITDCMDLANQTPTLNGSKLMSGGVPFRASFDWVVNENNFVTLFEQKHTPAQLTDQQRRDLAEVKRREWERDEKAKRDKIDNLKAAIFAEMKAEQGDKFDFDEYEKRCSVEIQKI